MVERAAVEKKVNEIVVNKMGLEKEPIQEANLGNDLGMDSLDYVDFIMAIEDEFDLEIPDQDADKIRTVKDVCDYIQLKVI